MIAVCCWRAGKLIWNSCWPTKAFAGRRGEGLARSIALRKGVACAHRDSVAYRVVRAYRYMLRDTLFMAWLSAAYEVQPDLKIGSLSNQWEGVLWEVIQKKPAHLLPAPFASWREFEREVLKTSLHSLGIGQPGTAGGGHLGSAQ
jgi:hypothetical protein